MELHKKYYIKKYLGAGIILLLIAGCSEKIYKNIQSSYDKSADFKQYKTFAWLPDKDSSDTKNIFARMRNNTMNYFTHCMGERGYKVNVDNPDVLLALLVKSKTLEKTDPYVTVPFSTTTVIEYGNPFLHPLNNPLKYNKPFTYKYFNYPKENAAAREIYIKNSITLNVIDRRQGKIVWTGTVNADLYDTTYLQMNLHPVVYDILEQYPVKPFYKHRNKTKDNR
jgi:hypothetical protein